MVLNEPPITNTPLFQQSVEKAKLIRPASIRSWHSEHIRLHLARPAAAPKRHVKTAGPSRIVPTVPLAAAPPRTSHGGGGG
jgi:hypothetical protein